MKKCGDGEQRPAPASPRSLAERAGRTPEDTAPASGLHQNGVGDAPARGVKAARPHGAGPPPGSAAGGLGAAPAVGQGGHMAGLGSP